jgi:hypothetical protein
MGTEALPGAVHDRPGREVGGNAGWDGIPVAYKAPGKGFGWSALPSAWGSVGRGSRSR